MGRAAVLWLLGVPIPRALADVGAWLVALNNEMIMTSKRRGWRLPGRLGLLTAACGERPVDRPSRVAPSGGGSLGAVSARRLARRSRRGGSAARRAPRSVPYGTGALGSGRYTSHSADSGLVSSAGWRT